MHDMHAVLAVDGGNTKTIALVAALDGTILGAGHGGCSDIYNHSAHAADESGHDDGAAAANDSAAAALANAARTV
jgi:N-acetylglucosamine kinase-like BadF-type ATPase